MSPVIRNHADVLAILNDPEHWSNHVSTHLNVPNGMDAPEHTTYRELIEPFFDAATLQRFQPTLQRVVSELFQALPDEFDVTHDLAYPFALRVQSAFMGWPRALENDLLAWIQQQQCASAQGDRAAMRRLADEFSQMMIAQFEQARSGNYAPDSVTARLVNLQVNGQRLRNDYLVSIVRNWTVGELGTIANAATAIVNFLHRNKVVRQQLLQAPEHIDHAVDEILRFNAPLASNRRRAVCPMHLTGSEPQPIATDTVVTLDWAAANTDPAVFEQPFQFRWDRDPRDNLLYGAGIHVCPGAPLARLELRLFTQAYLELLAAKPVTVSSLNYRESSTAAL